MVTKANLIKWIILTTISYFLYLQTSWLITFLIILFSIQVSANLILLSIPALYKRYILFGVNSLKNKSENYVNNFLTTDWIGFIITFFGVLASGSIYLIAAFLLLSCIIEVIVRPAIAEAYYYE